MLVDSTIYIDLLRRGEDIPFCIQAFPAKRIAVRQQLTLRGKRNRRADGSSHFA